MTSKKCHIPTRDVTRKKPGIPPIAAGIPHCSSDVIKMDSLTTASSLATNIMNQQLMQISSMKDLQVRKYVHETGGVASPNPGGVRPPVKDYRSLTRRVFSPKRFFVRKLTFPKILRLSYSKTYREIY